MKDLRTLATISRRRRGQEIAAPGTGDECWHHIIFGAARRYIAWPDGQRRIIDFLLQGDFLAPIRDHYGIAIEAVVDGTIIASYSRQQVDHLAESDPHIGGKIREATLAAAARLERQILLLGRPTALEKVGSFLLDMADRSSIGHPDKIILPMSRYDIADYLALSVETVSRSLTILKRRGVITLIGGRRVSILDRNALDHYVH
ncbi:MAG TPA: helix-turn-helix domain-containing protein [Stellaceae bacterium]|nr:helix-turn-helix domain-containing protein [Stellaceae bacterium]